MNNNLRDSLHELNNSKQVDIAIIYGDKFEIIDNDMVKHANSVEFMKGYNEQMEVCFDRLETGMLDKLNTHCIVYTYNDLLILKFDDTELAKAIVRVFKHIFKSVTIMQMKSIDDFAIVESSCLKEDAINRLFEDLNCNEKVLKGACVATRQISDITAADDLLWMSKLSEEEQEEHNAEFVIKYAKDKGSKFIISKVAERYGDKAGTVVGKFFDAVTSII